MNNVTGVTAAMFSAACVLLPSAGVAVDWPNFRGPNHDGISRERGLKTTWPEPMPLVWDRTVGPAFSSFAAVGDRIYTCGERDGKQALLCLNADTGEVVWETAIEQAYRDSHGDGTRATPTVDGDRVYIQGAHGRLLCVSAETGAEVWSHTFSNKPTWGYSGSVLIEGDLAISSGGGKDGAIVAFDKRTGKRKWKCGDDPAGYGTPYPFAFAGHRFVIEFTGNAAVVADLTSGQPAGRIPWNTDWNVNAAAPIYHDGHLFLTSGYSTGCALFKVSADGGGLSFDPVWKSKVLLNKFQSCILHDGNLYGSDQRGFKCVDWMTGSPRWKQPRIKHGTVTLADGFLYLLTERGELRIGRASPDGFTPVTTANILGGRCWTVPVLHRGRIYARNLERVVCFDLTP